MIYHRSRLRFYYITLKGHRILKEKSDIQQKELVNQDFQPFYERIPNRFAIPFIGKLLISILLGFSFLGPRYWAMGEEILNDWSWLLGMLIVVAMMSIYYATHTFRAMFPHLNVRLQSQDTTAINDAYFSKVERYLSDRMFLYTGLLFATLNCGIGRILETDYEKPWAGITIYLGYFIAGFVCGLAVCGIRGVVVSLSSYFEHRPRVDYTNPDECGGYLFLGDALIVFAGVTLIVGLMISLYIVETLGQSESIFPRVTMWLWIALPFVLSLTILLAPATRTNRALMSHKIQKEVELAMAIDTAKKALLQKGVNADRQKELRDEIEYHDKLRARLHNMRAWPFNTRSNIKAGILFISNAYIAFESVHKLLSGVP